MKRIILILIVIVFAACGERTAHVSQKTIQHFDIQVQKYENDFLTLHIRNTLGKGFAYASLPSSMSMMNATDVLYDQIHLVFVDTAVIEISSSFELFFFQFEEEPGGAKLKADGWCNLHIMFNIY